MLHSAVHKARHDVDCVIHTHTLAGMAVSAMKCGLLPLAQTAMRFTDVAYHDYEGVALNLDEQERVVRDLGDREAMILRNHGLLVVGASIAEAFNNIFRLERACQLQVTALSCNTELVDAAEGPDRGHQQALPARRAPPLRPARVAGAAEEAGQDRPVLPQVSRIPILLLAVVSLPGLAQGGRGIGYPTVAAALEALKARSDVNITVRDGWTIVHDPVARAYWSFTPRGHPAYPAAVKRTVVTREDGQQLLDMTALCQAEKAPCDRLIADFTAMNERMAADMRQRQSPSPSEIEVQRQSDDSYRLVLKSSRSRSVDAGQEELLPKAKEVCGGRNVGYGRYEFETSEPVAPSRGQPSTLILRQEITCGAAAGARPPTVSVANPDRNWRPSTAQVQLVERLTGDYFSAKDKRQYAQAYALFSPAQKQTLPFDQWSARTDQFNSKAGEARGRAIKRITWYKDPPQGGPGVFAAVDFSSQFANLRLHCGFVAWHEQPDGSFQLVREEENFVDMSREMKPGELEQIRAKFGMGC